MTALSPYAAAAGRTLLASLFLFSGVTKLGAYEATQGYMEASGAPGALLPLVIGLEILVPLAIITGYYARFAAFLLAGFSILAAAVFHFDFTDQIQSVMFLKNISIAGGLLLLVANGPGALSLTPNR